MTRLVRPAYAAGPPTARNPPGNCCVGGFVTRLFALEQMTVGQGKGFFEIFLVPGWALHDRAMATALISRAFMNLGRPPPRAARLAAGGMS
jgi:hypothetical protein